MKTAKENPQHIKISHCFGSYFISRFNFATIIKLMLRRLLIYFLFFLAFPMMFLHAQDPPELRCISVNSDGSITLQWIQPPDGTGFVEYDIFYSSSINGTYSLAGSVADYNTETFTHNAVNGMTASWYYYVVSEYGAGSSGPSATLRSMLLLLNSPNPETALLSWNAPANPLPSGMDDSYQVFMEYPAGLWSQVGTTTETNFEVSFQECNNNQDVVNFQVRLADPVGGCESGSSIMGETLFNYLKPAIPVMDSVSITPSGQVIIGWEPNPAQDTEGYVIYLVTGTNDSIDYVPGITTTTYIDPVADPCAASFSYALSAIDSCGNESPGTYDIPQNTLLVNDLEYDACLLTSFVSWNPYLNFNPPLDRYELFASENGGPFTRIATLDASTTGFLHEDLLPNTTYEYYVRAFSQGNQKSSTSCRKTFTTYDSPRPEFMYQRYATVNDEGDVEILFYTDTSAFVNQYTVFRATTQAGPYEEIGTVAPTAEPNLMYVDETANVYSQSYYYRISVTDTCGIETEIANLSRTILLGVTANEDRTNDLSWNTYSVWEGSVDRYEIYRFINDVIEPGPLANLPAGTTTYTDDVSQFGSSDALIDYIVIAYEGSGNSYGFQDESRSNIARALQESKVFVPTAFTPKGKNPTFRPVSSFITTENYVFAIYDRWGRQVFQTNDPQEAWDGTIDGQIANEGVYSWLLRYTTTGSEIIERTGNVMVLY
jgi:gliding motility-associated-like protein